ncbi:MAG: peptidylprolyl isomerase [Phycisphaerae bacterium]
MNHDQHAIKPTHTHAIKPTRTHGCNRTPPRVVVRGRPRAIHREPPPSKPSAEHATFTNRGASCVPARPASIYVASVLLLIGGCRATNLSWSPFGRPAADDASRATGADPDGTAPAADVRRNVHADAATPASPARSTHAGDAANGAEPPRRAESTVAGEPIAERDPAVLHVNDETLTAEDVLHDDRADLQRRASAMPPDAYRAYLRRFATQRVTDAVTEMLLHQHASRRLSPQESSYIDALVEDRIREVVTTEYDGSRRRFHAALEQQGTTPDDHRRRLHRDIVIQRFLQVDLKPKVAEPTRAELWNIYQDNADRWTRPPRRRMSLIEVRVLARLPEHVDNPTRDQMQTARNHARTIIESAAAELNDGTPFEDVARRYSDGTHAADGGAWGFLTSGSVKARLQPAVDKLYQLRQGDISDVVQGDDCFFLVRCDEIDPGFVPTFETVQPRLQEQFARSNYNARVTKLIQELHANAHLQQHDLDRFYDAVIAAAPQP